MTSEGMAENILVVACGMVEAPAGRRRAEGDAAKYVCYRANVPTYIAAIAYYCVEPR
jgi:hypothetical protein